MSKTTKKVSKGIATAALITNFFVPGLGTLILGKYTQGVIQLVLYIFSCVLVCALFWLIIPVCMGAPIMIGVWIWALIDGIKGLKEAE